YAGHAAGAIRLDEQRVCSLACGVGGLADRSPRTAGGVDAAPAHGVAALLEARPSAPEQLLEVLQHVVGLLAADGEQHLRELGRVVACHTPALHDLVERLLDPLAAEH